MSRCLIVNAEGYGWSRGVNRGIDEAVERGVVTSISVLANFPAIDELAHFARMNPHISVGVQLNPLFGTPVAQPMEIPSLLTTNGEFHFRDFLHRLRHGRIDTDELAHECTRQLLRVRDMGIHISHLDMPQRLAQHPTVFAVLLKVLRHHGVPGMRTHTVLIPSDSPRLRRDRLLYTLWHPVHLLALARASWQMRQARRQGICMADRLLGTGLPGYQAVLPRWLQILRNVPDGWSEIVCHPAYPDDTLRRWASYVEQRRLEIDVLTSRETHEEVARGKILLKTYHDLYQASAFFPTVLQELRTGVEEHPGGD